MKIVASFFASDSRCANCSKKFLFNKRRVCSSCKRLFCKLCSINVKKHHNPAISKKDFCQVCYSQEVGPVERSSVKTLHSAGEARVFHYRASSDQGLKNESSSALLPSFSEMPSNKLVIFNKVEEIKEGLYIRESKPKEFYKFVKRIGKGASSKVYLCENKKTTELVAIKKIRIPNDMVKKQIVNEILIAGSCSNPNVVKYIESFLYNDYLYVVMELMRGDLSEFIHDHKKVIQEDMICYILLEILKGLFIIHSSFRIHRDLKSDNILISEDGDVKLADFGFSAQLTQEEDKRCTIVGTPCWMAPELFLDGGYGCKVDVWALGIIALELAHGEPPRIREDTYRIMAMVCSLPAPQLENPENWSSYFKNFIEKCLEKDPALRWTAGQLLKHPLFQSNSSSSEKHKRLLKSWITTKIPMDSPKKPAQVK